MRIHSFLSGRVLGFEEKWLRKQLKLNFWARAPVISSFAPASKADGYLDRTLLSKLEQHLEFWKEEGTTFDWEKNPKGSASVLLQVAPCPPKFINALPSWFLHEVSRDLQ